MKRRILIFPLLLLCILSFSGCATHYVWTETPLDDFYEPGDPNSVRLYQSREKTDVLVCYNESKSSNDSSRPRCYYALKNQSRILARKKPYFINPAATNGLIAIPLTKSGPSVTNDSNLNFRASLTTHDDQFIISHVDGTSVGTFDLPVYPSLSGTVERVILTPATVVMDATIVGGIIWANAPFLPY